MASTYVNNLRLEEIGTGEQSGTWGDTTNTNLEIIGQAVAWGTRAIANASTDNITIADGALDADRCLGLKLTGGGQACAVTLLPLTSSKTWFIHNTTNSTLTFRAGSDTTSEQVAILAGETKVIATDGLGADSIVYDLLTAVNLAGVTKVDDLIVGDDLVVADDASVGGTLGVTGVLTATSLDISGDIDVDGTTNLDIVDIDGAVNMATTALVTGVLTTTAATVHTNGITMPDGAIAKFGTDDDLQISHINGTGSLIRQGGEGNLFIQGSDSIVFGAGDGSETLATFTDDGGCTLNFNNAAKIATKATGVTVTGEMAATTMDLSSNAVIDGTALVTGVLTSNGGAVFNEGGAAVDFRIESEDNEQIFIMDGDKNAIGINATDLPTDLPLTIMNSAHRTDFSLVALGIGGTEADDAVGVKSSIGFGFVSAARPIMPAVISYETKSTSGGTFGDLVFGTRPDVGNTQPTVRMTIKSDGKIGIATAAPAAPLQVDTDNGFPALVLSRDGGVSGRRPFGVAIGGNNDASMFINASNDTTGAGAFGSSRVVLMELEAAGDVNVKTGNLVIGTAGKGIDFAAQTSANSVSGVSTTAELLDHYEEGTWTPTMLQGSNAPAAYAQRTGYYTKVGNLVHLNGRVQLNGLGSMSGTIFMTGLPFTATNATNNFSAFHVGYYAGFALPTATATMMGIVNPNSVNVDLRLGNDVADSSSLTAAHVSADGDFIFSMTYKA